MNRFAKYAWGVLAWNVLVILWGAFVRASGSGAGCGSHWPSCNGQIIPRPERIETIIEFTHRAMSGIALLLILGLILWGFRAYGRGDPLRKSLVACGFFILLEALLGASLVLFKWVDQDQSVGRAIATAAHLLNTLLLLGSLTLTAWWAARGIPISPRRNRTLWLLFGMGLTGFAVIAMSGAITALGDTLFPPATLAAGFAQDADPGASFLVHLRVYHPIIAITVGLYTLYLVRFVRGSVGDPLVRRLSLGLGALVLVQWSAGIINLILLAPVWMQIVHLLIADLVWITYVLTAATALTKSPEAV